MVPADVTSAPDVERMVSQTADHFGRLDVVSLGDEAGACNPHRLADKSTVR